MYPQEFTDRMKRLLGDEFQDFLDNFEKEPHRALRLNPLKAEDESFLSSSTFSLRPVPWAEHGFYYNAEDTPGKHPYHEAGVYYIQEPSAMSAVPFLDVKPGERVLDLCAAPGGKSTQIGCALMGEGLLVANEIHKTRARILSSNIERLGITNAFVCNETPDSMAKFFPEFFHKILVDAPCSGEGMFRKNEEAVFEWSPENVALCASRQDDVLEEAAKMLLPGGRMVYSTCTFAPEENEGSVYRFLKSHPDFHLIKTVRPEGFYPGQAAWANLPEDSEIPDIETKLSYTHRLFPHKVQGEGHFIAVLERDADDFAGEGSGEANRDGKAKFNKKAKKKVSGKTDILKKAPAEFLEFMNSSLTEEGISFLCSEQSKGLTQYRLFGDQLYLSASVLPPLDGMHVLRPGLHLGTLIKGRFEPSHSLALALRASHVKRHYSFPANSDAISSYLEGQTLFLSEEDFPDIAKEKGWSLVLVDNYSLGWGKLADCKLKNHYPKGLRK